MSALLELAERCEKAEGPSADIDRVIRLFANVPRLKYSRSIDAALTLVPEGWGFNISWPNEMALASGILRVDAPCLGEVQYGSGQRFIVAAATPALALCAAALRARAA